MSRPCRQFKNPNFLKPQPMLVFGCFRGSPVGVISIGGGFKYLFISTPDHWGDDPI